MHRNGSLHCIISKYLVELLYRLKHLNEHRQDLMMGLEAEFSWLVLWPTGVWRDIIWPCLSDDWPDWDHKRWHLCGLGIWCWASCPPDGSCDSMQDLFWGGEGRGSFEVCRGESRWFQGQSICHFWVLKEGKQYHNCIFKCSCLFISFVKESSGNWMLAFNVSKQ